MQTKRGIAVSQGVAIGSVLVIGTEDFRIPFQHFMHGNVEKEVNRLTEAMTLVATEINENERVATEKIGKHYGAIFTAHLQMAQDPKLLDELQQLIRQKHYTAEFAVSRVLRKYAKQFLDLGKKYFSERAADIYDLEKRILQNLLGTKREDLKNLSAPVLVLAHNLTPSETANLDREHVLGFATEVGGPTSHTAILAGAMEIPAVVGLGSFINSVSGGETAIIDGNNGLLIIDPPVETLQRYRDQEDSLSLRRERFRLLDTVSPVTKDGVRVQLMGNVEFPEESLICSERGADGIGLYRTEFLYLGQQTMPTEQDHYVAYGRVFEYMKGKPVVIRTLDVGADKIPGSFEHLYHPESNPVLGLRSIRLSLHELSLFKTQIRAILRAALDADVWIMFPLVSTLLEYRQARMYLREVIEDLEEQGIPHNPNVKTGIMIEVPAAAIMADHFAREVDFFSIGTNDLIQYTMAADRSDPMVAKWFSSGDPAILKLLSSVISAAIRENISVSVCGQMSSDPRFVPLLLGLGLRTFSVTPQSIPLVKEVVRNLSIKRAEKIAKHTLTLDLARDVESYLRRELNQICPELIH